MTIQEAINFVDIARMNYICDPHECGLEKGKDPCTAFHCDEMHDALVMAIEALEKQTPKNAELETEEGEYAIFLCPNCKRIFHNHIDEPQYCDECGQAISWEGVIQNE